MICRAVEIRDHHTFVPALAIRLEPANPAQRYLFRRAGFTVGAAVVVVKLTSGESAIDPFAWADARTMRQAHRYLVSHFDKIRDGDVIDVAHLLGETDRPAESERVMRDALP